MKALVMEIAIYHDRGVFASTIPEIVSVTVWKEGFPSISGGSRARVEALCVGDELKSDD
jgi:hypothetical protein